MPPNFLNILLEKVAAQRILQIENVIHSIIFQTMLIMYPSIIHSQVNSLFKKWVSPPMFYCDKAICSGQCLNASQGKFSQIQILRESLLNKVQENERVQNFPCYGNWDFLLSSIYIHPLSILHVFIVHNCTGLTAMLNCI